MLRQVAAASTSPPRYDAHVKRPYVAVCLGGAARTFVHPQVQRSLKKNVISALDAEVEVFACLSSDDLCENNLAQKTCLNQNQSAVFDALDNVGAQRQNVRVDRGVCSSAHVPLPDCANYTKEGALPSGKYEVADRRGFSYNAQSLAKQLGYMKMCYHLVITYEKTHANIRFAAVLRARPDLLWYRPMLPWRLFDGHTPRHLHDWADFVPREHMVGQ